LPYRIPAKVHGVGTPIGGYGHGLSIGADPCRLGALRRGLAERHSVLAPEPMTDARNAPGSKTQSWRLPTEDSGDEIALLGGVDMLLEPSDLPIGEGPHMGHLHFGRLAGALAVPGVGAEGHHSVALGDQLRDID